MRFTSTIDLIRVLKSRVFDVRDKITVVVTCNGRMDRPAPCPFPVYSIELEEKGLVVDSSHGERLYPANGSSHSEAWHDLPSGRYYLIDLDRQQQSELSPHWHHHRADHVTASRPAWVWWRTYSAPP